MKLIIFCSVILRICISIIKEYTYIGNLIFIFLVVADKLINKLAGSQIKRI